MNTHRILVVDDEPNVAFFFQKHLEMVDSNYTAKAVNSGAAAIEELTNHHYDLMITDLRMPKMNGLELLQRMRQVSPHTRAILMTAYGSHQVWQQAQELEVFRSLSKPIKIPDLLALVQEAFKKTNATALGGILTLTDDIFEQLATSLETLRIDVGAQAVLLADTTGRILVDAGCTEEIDTSSMMALLGSTMAASGELSHQLKYPHQTHLSYFEGPPYDLYATNLGKDFFLTIIQNRGKETNRIGVVWLYTQRAISHIMSLLGREANETTSLGNEFADSIQSELDDFFCEPEAPPTAVSPASPPPPANALSRKVHQTLAQFGEQTGLKISQHLTALDTPMTSTTTTLLMQTIGATLRNVYRHAQARHVTISFSYAAPLLQGYVKDDGIGLNPHQPLRSLTTLQARYAQAGGKLDIFSSPNQGTTVTICLPIMMK